MKWRALFNINIKNITMLVGVVTFKGSKGI